MAEITPLVHDVSSHAGPWWTQLMQHVGQVYKKWLASDSLTRLLFTVDIEVKPNALWLESRMASMWLAALPASLKAEVIVARKLTAGAVMLEVLKRFQPGGLSKKSALRTCRRHQHRSVRPMRSKNSDPGTGIGGHAPRSGRLADLCVCCGEGCPGKGAASVVPHTNVATPAWAGCQG